MLSRGRYLGELYDIGFDRPEAHAIRKPAGMYYAFYAPEWNGKIELRGFGSFRIRSRSSRQGRNPKTGSGVAVPAKKVPYFKPGKEIMESRPQSPNQ
jgi:alpha-galactosidase